MKNYKTIFGILASAALVALVSSCDLNKFPVFDDDDAFAAFDATSYTVDENVGVLSIPVTVASVAGLSTTVTYAVVDGTGTAGVNYEVVDENGTPDASGVLTFASGERTKYINVKITDITDENCEDYGYDSGFTGNFTFSVSLVSSTSVYIGLDDTCSVTILDLDHPLASLVGTYYCTDTEDWGSGADTWEWYAEMYTDPDDTSIIWICGLDSYFEDYGYIDDVYGTVDFDDDNKPVRINIALPFWVGAYGSYYLCYTHRIFYYVGDEVETEVESTTLHLDYDETTGSWVSDTDFFVDAFFTNGDLSDTSYAGYYDYIYEGATYTKID